LVAFGTAITSSMDLRGYELATLAAAERGGWTPRTARTRTARSTVRRARADIVVERSPASDTGYALT